MVAFERGLVMIEVLDQRDLLIWGASEKSLQLFLKIQM